MSRVWKWVRRSLGGAVVVLLLVFAGFAIDGRIADDLEVTPLNLDPETRIVVLLFHGSRDSGNPLWGDLTSRFAVLLSEAPGVEVINYNWSKGSDERRRAGANAGVYAQALGQELAGLEQLSHVRLVAHSAGAYILDDLCRTYREAAGLEAHLEMTFLDPFGNYDVVDVNRGSRNYGACADFASAYINTDDPVPSTNTPLQNAYNFDVTNSPDRGDFSAKGHYWPLSYFLGILDEALARPGGRTHTDAPRGEVVLVD